MRALLLLLCVTCLAGCAASAYNLAEAPPRVGLQGYHTVLHGRRLNPQLALEFYEDAGAVEAADAQALALRAYGRGKLWWLGDLAIGAVVGALGGALQVAQSDPNAPGNNSYSQSQTVVGWAMVGVGLSAPLGALHAWQLKRGSQERFREAVDLYNRRYSH